MIRKKYYIYLLFLLTQNLDCYLGYLSEEECKKLSSLLNMPQNSDWLIYSYLIEEEVLPLLKEQITKYHPGATEPFYKFSENDTWYADVNSVYIPMDFIAHIIKHRIQEYKEYNESLLNKIVYAIYGPSDKHKLKKDISFWEAVASFHHELTHVKKSHVLQKASRYGPAATILFYKLANIMAAHNKNIDDIKGDFADLGPQIIDLFENFLELSRKHEQEADDGIPNHRLMLIAIQQCFESSSKSNNSDLGHLKHPSDKDRAARFGQRLELLLKKRAQIVNRAFCLDKLPKIPAPHNMPHAAKLLNIESEHYETILDLIGEHKAA